MTIHVRSCLVVEVEDKNGDIVAVRRKGTYPTGTKCAAIFLPGWTFHRIGGGDANYYAHIVESDSCCDGEFAPATLWARGALEWITKHHKTENV